MKNRLWGKLNRQIFEYPKHESDGTDEIISVEKRGVGHILEQNSTDLIIRVELKPSPRLDYINPACLRITGYTQEEFYAEDDLLDKLVHPDDAELRDRFKNYSSEKPDKSAMLRWIRKDGKQIWTDQVRHIIRDENGKPTALYIIVRDITQDLQTKLDLEAMEEKFAKTFQASPHPICIIDLENDKFIDVNDGFIRFSGYTREEIIGRTPLELNLHPNEEDITTMKSILAKDGRMYKVEFSNRTKSGEIRIALFSAEIISFAGKLCVVFVITDITDQKRLEAANRESEEKYKAIFDNVNAIVVWLDKLGYIVEANAKAVDLFGIPREDVIGRHFAQIKMFAPKELPRLLRLFNEAMAGKNNGFVDDVAALNNEGEEFFVNIYYAVAKKDGDTNGVVCILHDITAQKKAEEARRESEEKYKSIFDNIGDIVVRLDKMGKITEINSRVEEIYGFKREELLGKSFTELGVITARDLPKLIKIFTNTVQGKQNTYREKLQTRHKTGKPVFIDAKFTVVRKNGKAESIVALVSDITQQMKTEHALKKSEDKFSKIFSSSPNPVCITALDGRRFIDANESFLRFIGYSREEIIGRTAAELNLWVEEDAPHRMNKILFDTGTLCNIEINSRRKSGEIRTGLFSGNIVEIDGKLCLALLVTDITEQKWAEEALRESEEFTSSLLKNNPTPIFVTYPDTSIKYVNPAFETLTGYSLTDVIGLKLPYPWWPEESRKEIATLFLDGSIDKKEMAYRKKNGERFWVEVHRSTINQGENKNYLLINWVDITERKQIELALRESEEKFSKAFYSSPDCMAISKLDDGQYIEVNDSFLRFTGYSREYILGKSFHNITKWDISGSHNLILEKLRTEGRVVKEECSFRMKSGEIKTMWYSAETLKIRGVNCVLSITTDITERKQIELALLESQEKFAKAFNSAANAMALFAGNGGKFVEVNDCYVALSGYAREEIIGHNADELNMWADDKDRFKILHSVKETGRVLQHEFGFRTKSGEIRTCLFSAEPIHVGDEDRMIVVIQDVTESKRAEEALKTSEENFRHSLDDSPFGIRIIDAAGQTLYYNKTIIGIYGYRDIEEFSAVPIEKRFTPEGYQTHLKLLQKMARGEPTPEKGETSIIRKDGEIRYLEVLRKDVLWNGKTQFMLLYQDITERKRMEKALRESEEKFSKAFSTSANAICIAGLDDDTLLEVNESYCRFSGYSREEILGHTPRGLKIANEKDLVRLEGLIKKDGKLHNQEIQSRAKSGEIRVGLVSAEVMDIGGRQCRIVVITDITERKKAEEALKESEEFNSTLLTNTHNAIFVTYPDGAIKYVNPAFEKLTGFHLPEIIGRKTPYPWWPEDKKDEIEASLQETVPGEGVNLGDKLKKQMTFRKKNGELFTVDLSATVIKNNGQRQYILVTWIDITERIRMEKALRESEEKFSKAFSASANAICISKLSDNKFIEVNDGFCRFTGYTREEVLGRTSAQLNLWTEGKEILQFKNQLDREGRFQNLEIHSRTKSGDIRVGLFSAEIINIGGLPCRIVAITDITERKQMEEALRESEEKFSKAFHGSPGAVAISTYKDGRIIDVNQSFYRVMGFTQEEAVGHTAQELRIWADDNGRNLLLAAVENQGKPHAELLAFRRKSGDIGLGMFSSQKIIINNEQCLITVNIDVTEQKKAEERSRLLGSVTQQVTDSIIVTDQKYRITYMNKAAQDLYGYPPDELLGISLGTMNAAASEKQRKEIYAMVSKGKTWSGTIIKKRKDGSTFLCDCRQSPLLDEKGQVISYICVHRDITEQKRIEAEIKGQKQLIENILSSMPEGVLVLDGTDGVLLANESFRKIFHTRRKTLEGSALNSVINAEQFFDLYSSIRNGRAENQSTEFRYKYRGHEQIIVCAIIKMGNDHMLLIFSDVSREREREDKLYLNDRLASLGQMAAGLAHELNNPLTGILTLSQLLVKSDIPVEYKEDLECVYGEAKRAANIVKNVLLFTRNNSYENGRSSVNEAVKEIFRLREHEETVKHIKAVTNLRENLPEVAVDRYQLQQVLLNIILNGEAAIEEAKRPGTITVTTESNNGQVTIKFTDNGCGIKKQVLPRIFDPFFTTKEIGKGTGLGLSICYGIIIKHNGKISVKTQVGKGTTFTVKLPIAAENDTSAAAKGE